MMAFNSIVSVKKGRKGEGGNLEDQEYLPTPIAVAIAVADEVNPVGGKNKIYW